MNRMKKETKIQFGIIIALLIILSIMCIIYFNSASSNSNVSTENWSDITVRESGQDVSLISTDAEVKSALTEKVELHATYYLQECYIQENQIVDEGEKILLYSNGEYLNAPYKCVISSINIPEIGAQCKNENYIEISSLNMLSASLSVDESVIDNITIGDIVSIEITAFDDKVLEGYVTKISSIGSAGKFTVNVEFENDGEVMIGMGSKICLKK